MEKREELVILFISVNSIQEEAWALLQRHVANVNPWTVPAWNFLTLVQSTRTMDGLIVFAETRWQLALKGTKAMNKSNVRNPLKKRKRRKAQAASAVHLHDHCHFLLHEAPFQEYSRRAHDSLFHA